MIIDISVFEGYFPPFHSSNCYPHQVTSQVGLSPPPPFTPLTPILFRLTPSRPSQFLCLLCLTRAITPGRNRLRSSTVSSTRDSWHSRRRVSWLQRTTSSTTTRSAPSPPTPSSTQPTSTPRLVCFLPLILSLTSVWGPAIAGSNKRHSTPATLLWLDQHYHLETGICIPRNSVYYNYVDFCSKNKMTPVNAASFGKVGVCVYCIYFKKSF